MTLHPGPLFLYALALRPFMPYLCPKSQLISPSNSFSILCLIFSESETIFLYLFVWVCVKVS